VTPNQKAFLDMLGWSEIGPELLAESDNGYNVLVGSTPAEPLLFHSYADHPNIYNTEFDSTAAGRYQLLYHWWVPYKRLLGLTDFSPASQDAVALQQIRERGALPLIEAGDIRNAISRCSNIWASLPGNSYGQHANTVAGLVAAFEKAGGRCA
jgi:muramidase (phage lysozyme)